MPSKKAIALLVASTLAITTWAGYRAECRVMDSAGNKPITLKSVVRRVTAPKSRTQQIDKLNELRQRAGHSEPSQEDNAAAWKIIRAMTVEDVKAYLEEIPMKPERMVNQSLVCMLFSRWAQLDPEGAAAMVSQAPYVDNYGMPMAVAIAWAERDPLAALRWSGKLGGNAKYIGGQAAGKMLVQQDPATALERALAETPEALNGVAYGLGSLAGDTEEARRATLLRLAGLKNNGQALDYYLNGLAKRIGKDKELSQSLLAEIDSAGLPEERVAEIKATLTSRLQRYDPPQTPPVTLEVDSNLPPELQKRNYSQWSVRDPDKAVAWAEQNGRTDLVADTVKKETMNLLRSNWQPGVRPENGSPWVKGVVPQYQSWKKLDPAAAETWLKTMPSDIRKHLSPTSSGDATH